MKNDSKIAIFIVGFILMGIFVGVFFPKEQEKNPEAILRIGAGDDMSGILMDETVALLSDEYEVSETLESSSFQNC